MYDIASYRTVGDTLLVSVLRDINEEVIVGLITDHFSSDNNTAVRGTDSHISSKHSHSPNDVKTICERITFSPAFSFAAGKSFAASRFINYDLQSSIAIEIPPPRA